MNPQGADLLAQLRDIHSAPTVPWWPPAPGWWVLAVLLAIGLIFAGRYALRRLRHRLRRQRLAGFVDAVEAYIDPVAEPQEFLAAINRIFKIVAIGAFPDDHCARMQGAEWTGFLAKNLSQSPAAGQLAVLEEGPYQPAASFEPEILAGLARHWIRQYG
jgi:hypothetical protein